MNLTIHETSFSNMFNLLQVKQVWLCLLTKQDTDIWRLIIIMCFLSETRLSFPNQHLTLTLPATIIFEGFHSKTLYNHFGGEKKKFGLSHMIPQKHNCFLCEQIKLHSYFNRLVTYLFFAGERSEYNTHMLTCTLRELIIAVIIPPLHTRCEETILWQYHPMWIWEGRQKSTVLNFRKNAFSSSAEANSFRLFGTKFPFCKDKIRYTLFLLSQGKFCLGNSTAHSCFPVRSKFLFRCSGVI